MQDVSGVHPDGEEAALPVHRSRVTWPDMQGRELVSVREFEPSEPGEYDIDFGNWEGKRSCCSLM